MGIPKVGRNFGKQRSELGQNTRSHSVISPRFQVFKRENQIYPRNFFVSIPPHTAVKPKQELNVNSQIITNDSFLIDLLVSRSIAKVICVVVLSKTDPEICTKFVPGLGQKIKSVPFIMRAKNLVRVITSQMVSGKTSIRPNLFRTTLPRVLNPTEVDLLSNDERLKLLGIYIWVFLASNGCAFVYVHWSNS